MSSSTERLYYTDPHLTEFEATVVSLEGLEAGTAAVLDRTAFYPSSGGQPFDTGTLGGAAVVDVVDRPDGSIAHVVRGALEVGALVRGRIDWSRRFDHMQQHTGQHVLSAAFDRVHHARTESFHLGSTAATIDLARDLSADAIAAAEAEANRVVWEDRPVSIRFASAEEAAAMPLRKEPVRGGALRLIEVKDFDLSACGGTHVASTGAIGIIVVSSWERFKGGTRVEFRCGGRALSAYRALRETVAASLRQLSVLPDELPAAIDRTLNDGKELRRRVKDYQARLAVTEAAALAERAARVGGVAVVVEAIEGYDAAGLKGLAQAIAGRPQQAAVLFGISAAGGSNQPPPGEIEALVAVSRSPDVRLDAAAVLRALTARFGGRGGGKPELAQGGGLRGDPAGLLDAARDTIARELTVDD